MIQGSLGRLVCLAEEVADVAQTIAVTSRGRIEEMVAYVIARGERQIVIVALYEAEVVRLVEKETAIARARIRTMLSGNGSCAS